MAEVSLVWDGVVEPTGTLFIDDLEELEELLGSEDSTVEWSLGGRRELGSAKVTAATIAELAGFRNQVLDPETLELEVRDHVPHETKRFIANVHTMEDGLSREDRAWRATISATGEYRDRFEHSVRGLAEIFGRASQTTWAREHKRFHSVIREAWVFLLLGAVFMLSPFEAVLEADWRIAVILAGLYSLVVVGSYLLRRRLDSNASWTAPYFDLRNTRSAAQLAGPPEILSRDIVIAGLSMVVTLVIGAIATAYFT